MSSRQFKGCRYPAAFYSGGYKKMTTKILIADDHDVIREGIKSILREQKDYKVVGEVSSGEDAVSNAEELKPDVLLLDISMPKKSGLDILKQVKYVSPKTKIIMITVHRAGIYIDKAFASEVKGYISKENVVEDLLPALRAVLRGEVYVSSKISQYLLEKTAQRGKELRTEFSLTEREADILRLVAEGKTAKEIAEILFISPRTVENYKNILLRKLNLHKTTELVKYAVEHKVVETEE